MSEQQVFYLVSAVVTAFLSWIGLSLRSQMKAQGARDEQNAFFVERITAAQDKITDTLDNHLKGLYAQGSEVLAMLKTQNGVLQVQNERLLNAALRVPERAEITARLATAEAAPVSATE